MIKIREFFISILLCMFRAYTSNAFGLGILGDIVTSATDITIGTATNLPNFIPPPNFLLQTTKQIVAGYPFEITVAAIHHVCSAAMASDAVKPRVTPDINNMNFVLMTRTKNYSFPLTDADQMWYSPAFDRTKKVVIFSTGWTTYIEKNVPEVVAMAEAYLCRGDSNIVIVDPARYINTLYTWSAFNTEAIGESIGKGLAKLIQVVPVENIHLIGHSLGAHIVGAAGRTFTELTGQLLPRITGLDPANPCFNEGETLSGLQRGDAKFIDVIHSNSGALGKRDPLGDVDFYPGGVTSLPPGCVDVGCAHARSWQYYTETVKPGNEMNFMATRCTSLYKLKAGMCKGNKYPMGFSVPHTIRGNYVSDVNAKEPFGPNASNEPPKCVY